MSRSLFDFDSSNNSDVLFGRPEMSKSYPIRRGSGGCIATSRQLISGVPQPMERCATPDYVDGGCRMHRL
jgi:hypothetical protein